MSTVTRWTPQLLRHAIWLSLTPTPTGAPNLPAAAAAAGVTTRSLQRWLAGTTRPSPQHAQALRDALAPPTTALASQAAEHRWAHNAAKVIAAPRGRGVSPAWRSRGWHRPHEVHVLSHEQLGVHRVAVILGDRVKPLYHPGGWQIVSTAIHPHRPAALLAREQLLTDHQDARVDVRPGLLSTGRHLCWLPW